MGEVVKLPPKPEIVYVCSECGCQTFYLHEDSHTECANCGSHDGGSRHWREHAFVPVDVGELPPEVSDLPASRVIQLGDPQRAKRTTMDRACDRNVIAVVVFKEDGGFSSWFGDPALTQEWWEERYTALVKSMAEHGTLIPTGSSPED